MISDEILDFDRYSDIWLTTKHIVVNLIVLCELWNINGKMVYSLLIYNLILLTLENFFHFLHKYHLYVFYMTIILIEVL